MQTHPAVLALVVVLASPPGRSAVDCHWMTIQAAGTLRTSAAGLVRRTCSCSVVGDFGREAAAWAVERTSSVAVALVVQTSAVAVALVVQTFVVAVASAEQTSAVEAVAALAE